MNLSELPQHHAVLLTHSDRKSLANKLWEELKNDSYAHRFFDQTVLDIESTRQLISWTKSAYNGERTALISFHTIGIPAQNALLKILEEPQEKIRFILITSNKSNLIPTVLSRLSHHEPKGLKQEDRKYAQLFLETPPSQRIKLDFITKLLTKTDEEDRKDREAVRTFILSLTSELSIHKDFSKFITETLEVASYASDPSSSGKALLEYLALLLPQIKD